MDRRKKLGIFLAIAVAAVALYGVGLAVLPHTLVMQISSSGAAGTTLPKPLGLAIPLGLTLFFGFRWYRADDNRYFIFAVLGLLLNLLTFIMNG